VARCIAFHSYKGGTGKTTLAANLAALLAKKGHNVFLLDLDVYAPSIQAYFDVVPGSWVNDYLNDEADVGEIMKDFTHLVSGSPGAGKLWVGFSNPRKEEIYRLEGVTQKNSKSQLFRRFVQLREKLIFDYDINYIIIDTSPGLRFWSISALAISDTYFLALKAGDMDITGTKSMAKQLYESLTKYGAKPFLLLNKTPGYCKPDESMIMSLHSVGSRGGGEVGGSVVERRESDAASALARQIGIEVISSIPCYCDIQFSKKEFLTVLKYPEHPFAKKIGELAESGQIRL
jgi:MinD-like ATPase involved in chromosome partitioning or flagellar assembly